MAWEGQIKPQALHIRISEPIGVDRQALVALSGHPLENATELLERFPTSKYAAYAIWQHSDAKGLAESQPHKVLKAVETGLIYQSEMVLPCPDVSGKMSPRRCNGREATACRAYWYAIVLKNHPDIWFADQIRLRSAIDQLALKNTQAAQADLEAIAKSEISGMAPKAKQYLDLMKQNGWIKE